LENLPGKTIVSIAIFVIGVHNPLPHHEKVTAHREQHFETVQNTTNKKIHAVN